MKRLRNILNVSDISLTLAVLAMIAVVIPIWIILKLVNTRNLQGEPSTYDAYILISVMVVWLYVLSFVLFYLLYIQKYDMNASIVIRRKTVRRVWLNSQGNMAVTILFYTVYVTIVTGILGMLLTGKVCNWNEKYSRVYMSTGYVAENPPPFWLFILAFMINVFAVLYVSGTIMMFIWWLTDMQWIGFIAAIAIATAENLIGKGYMTVRCRLNFGMYKNGVSVFENIVYPLALCIAVSFITTLIIRRKDFLK